MQPLSQISWSCKALFSIFIQLFEVQKRKIYIALTLKYTHYGIGILMNIRIPTYYLNSGGATYDSTAAKLGLGKSTVSDLA